MPCSKSLKSVLSPDTRYTFEVAARFALLAFPPETWAAENELPRTDNGL